MLSRGCRTVPAVLLVVLLTGAVLAGCTSTGTPDTDPTGAVPAVSNAPVPAGLPRPDHIVVAVFENHEFGQVAGASAAPAFNALAASGAVLTNSFGVTHPSQPNYLALFSGSTQAITNDSCPHSFTADNLGSQLLGAGLTFTGYSEGLPSVGYAGCTRGRYARKHNPWVNFSNLPASVNQPYSAFPRDFASLPTVSFVVPDLCHDMHDCSVGTGDAWLGSALSEYASWAAAHNSLLIVTFDEDDAKADNRITTIIAGAHVRPGRYPIRIDHYSMLRTIEACYGLTPLARAGQRAPISDVWA